MDAGIGTIVAWMLASALISVPTPGPAGAFLRSTASVGVLAGVSIPAFVRYKRRAEMMRNVGPAATAVPRVVAPNPLPRPAPAHQP